MTSQYYEQYHPHDNGYYHYYPNVFFPYYCAERYTGYFPYYVNPRELQQQQHALPPSYHQVAIVEQPPQQQTLLLFSKEDEQPLKQRTLWISDQSDDSGCCYTTPQSLPPPPKQKTHRRRKTTSLSKDCFQFKTIMCSHVTDRRGCCYPNCGFAHTFSELLPRIVFSNYKQKKCRITTSECPYETNCNYSHDGETLLPLKNCKRCAILYDINKEPVAKICRILRGMKHKPQICDCFI